VDELAEHIAIAMSAAASQALEVGSIPIARSIIGCYSKMRADTKSARYVSTAHFGEGSDILKIPLMGRAGMKIRAEDGFEELGFPELISTPLFYRAHPGDKLILLDAAYEFSVATYSLNIDPQWIHSYTYALDQSWTAYNCDLSETCYRQSDYLFKSDVYFRVCLRKISGEALSKTENINNIIAFDSNPIAKEPKLWIEEEVKRTIERINIQKNAGDLVFILISDTHYNINGTWEDTQKSIELLSREINPNAIIHLGDMTDGMVTRDATIHYVNLIFDGLNKCGVPIWVSLGNHDANYFRNNNEPFTIKEQREIYLDNRDISYYQDLAGVRLIFLDSFRHNEQLRYGFSPDNIQWLENTLEETPDDIKVIIFSHLPPFTRLQYWKKIVRGENELALIFKLHREKIFAWINGHNHADRLDNQAGFPIISIANAKCEAYHEHKTNEFLTPERKLDEASQELFDILLLNLKDQKAHFVRFGAGRDKVIVENVVKWI